MKEERTNDIDRMREYEDIRQVPLEPNRPASGRQNPPVGGFLHRGQAQTRADFQEKARYRRWGAGGQNVCSQKVC